MSEKNPETLILGVQSFDAPFGFRPPLYWDKEKEDKGYHSIKWEKTDEGHKIKKRSYIWGTTHEEQAGVVLDELVKKTPDNWFWAKEPVPIFPGANGFYIKKDLAKRLKDLSEEDIFSGIEIRDELYEKDVLVGFGTTNTIQSRKLSWYELLQSSADNLLRQYLKDGNNEAQTEEVTNWLIYLSTTESQAEQAQLRYLTVHQPNINDSRLGMVCKSLGSTYEMYDQEAGTGLVRRTDDGREIIVPLNKIFANSENVRMALNKFKSDLI